MDEYVRHVVRLEMFVRRILGSPIYRRFFAAAPGLKELMVLGKVMVLEEARARFSHAPLWDLIVLDAPATGHGLAFLKVPLAASAAVPVGPIGHNARRVLGLLRDPARTALVLVAIPEEMAVVEAVQFHRMAREEIGLLPSALVLNACHERRFSDEDEAEVLRLTAEGADGELEPGVPLPAALRAARRQIRRRRLTRFYQARLRRSLDVPLVSLPFLFREALGLEDLRLLAAKLEAA
jgi:anion-transporting  ArsA/GET3 family ATPase